MGGVVSCGGSALQLTLELYGDSNAWWYLGGQRLWLLWWNCTLWSCMQGLTKYQHYRRDKILQVTPALQVEVAQRKAELAAAQQVAAAGQQPFIQRRKQASDPGSGLG